MNKQVNKIKKAGKIRPVKRYISVQDARYRVRLGVSSVWVDKNDTFYKVVGIESIDTDIILLDLFKDMKVEIMYLGSDRLYFLD